MGKINRYVCLVDSISRRAGTRQLKCTLGVLPIILSNDYKVRLENIGDTY